MRSALAIVVLLVALLASNEARAQDLWQQSRHGMTAEQVREAFPDAVPAAITDRLRSGAVKLLEIRDYQIVGKSFDAGFFFLDGRLVQVTLKLKQAGPYRTAMVAFHSLADALRIRYGKEMSSKEEPGGLMGTAEAKWLSGRTNITLICMGVGNNEAVMNLVYQVRLSEEADKL